MERGGKHPTFCASPPSTRGKKTLSFSPLMPQHPAGHRATRSCLHVPDASHPSSHPEPEDKDLNLRTEDNESRPWLLHRVFRILLWRQRALGASSLAAAQIHQLQGSPWERTPDPKERLACGRSRATLTRLGQGFPWQPGPRIQDHVKPRAEPRGTAPRKPSIRSGVQPEAVRLDAPTSFRACSAPSRSLGARQDFR